MKKTILNFVSIMLIASFTMAQDFSGKYTISSKEMIDGKEYINAIAQEITVTQTRDSIKIIRVTPAGDDKTTTSTETLPLNGNKFIYTTSSKRERISFLSFDKATNSATIISTFSYGEKPGEVEFRNTEIWHLASDGTLTITKTSDATLTDDWTIKAVYRKG